MGLYQRSVLMANEAFIKIGAFGRQASSYASSRANTARGISYAIAHGAGKGLRGNMLKGAVAGGAIGAGYNFVSDDNSDWRSMLRAGAKGAGAGALIEAGWAGGRSTMNVMKARRTMGATWNSASNYGSGVWGNMKNNWAGRVARARS